MTDFFPTTQITWLQAQMEVDADAARTHVYAEYFEPLCAYVRASSLATLGEPAELVNAFFASRVIDGSYLARWCESGMPLRRYLVNGLLTHTRNTLLADSRRAKFGRAVDPLELERLTATHQTSALMALERAWAVRTVTQAHERVQSSFERENRSAWWELFRLHSLQGMSYAQACPLLCIEMSNATNVHRAVVARLKEALRTVLELEGIRPDELDRELASLQDLLR
jgi:hypothetical protein